MGHQSSKLRYKSLLDSILEDKIHEDEEKQDEENKKQKHQDDLKLAIKEIETVLNEFMIDIKNLLSPETVEDTRMKKT